MRFLSSAAAALLAVTIASGVARAQAPVKIAYINSDALLSAAPGRAAAESTFNAEAVGFRAQIQALSDSLDKVIAAYQKREPTLTQAQKDVQTKAIGQLQAEFQTKNQQIQQAANQRQNELMTPVMENIKKVVDDIRAEDGYSLVLDNAPGSTTIVSADKNLDITDRVMTRLRASKAPAPAAATPTKPASTAAPVGVTRKPPTQ
jgi:outer membrane protein